VPSLSTMNPLRSMVSRLVILPPNWLVRLAPEYSFQRVISMVVCAGLKRVAEPRASTTAAQKTMPRRFGPAMRHGLLGLMQPLIWFCSAVIVCHLRGAAIRLDIRWRSKSHSRYLRPYRQFSRPE